MNKMLGIGLFVAFTFMIVFHQSFQNSSDDAATISHRGESNLDYLLKNTPLHKIGLSEQVSSQGE